MELSLISGWSYASIPDGVFPSRSLAPPLTSHDYPHRFGGS